MSFGLERMLYHFGCINWAEVAVGCRVSRLYGHRNREPPKGRKTSMFVFLGVDVVAPAPLAPMDFGGIARLCLAFSLV